MVAAAARGAASHADDVALAGHALPDAQAAHGVAESDDLAGIFMADRHRRRNGLLRPFVPVEDMDVGAADAGLVDLHQNVVGPDLRLRNVGEPQAGGRLFLDEGLHAIAPLGSGQSGIGSPSPILPTA